MHMHCSRCFVEISIAKEQDGEVVPVPPKTVGAWKVAPGPRGVELVPVLQPVCDVCFSEIEQEQKQAALRRVIAPAGLALV